MTEQVLGWAVRDRGSSLRAAAAGQCATDRLGIAHLAPLILSTAGVSRTLSLQVSEMGFRELSLIPSRSQKMLFCPGLPECKIFLFT